jgi:hypothetical protein
MMKGKPLIPASSYERSTDFTDREPSEYISIGESFNPSIHRINNAVKTRAAHPNQPLPEIPQTLLRFSAPAQDLIERVQNQIDGLVEAAEVKKGEVVLPMSRCASGILIYPSATESKGQA